MKHIELTGADNFQIIKNMEYISSQGLLYKVRTVRIEGFTDDGREIAKIAQHIGKLNNYTRLKLLPFRPDGVKSALKQKPPLDESSFG